jgi:hypothetical protein
MDKSKCIFNSNMKFQRWLDVNSCSLLDSAMSSQENRPQFLEWLRESTIEGHPIFMSDSYLFWLALRLIKVKCLDFNRNSSICFVRAMVNFEKLSSADMTRHRMIINRVLMNLQEVRMEGFVHDTIDLTLKLVSLYCRELVAFQLHFQGSPGDTAKSNERNLFLLIIANNFTTLCSFISRSMNIAHVFGNETIEQLATCKRLMRVEILVLKVKVIEIVLLLDNCADMQHLEFRSQSGWLRHSKLNSELSIVSIKKEDIVAPLHVLLRYYEQYCIGYQRIELGSDSITDTGLNLLVGGNKQSLSHLILRENSCRQAFAFLKVCVQVKEVCFMKNRASSCMDKLIASWSDLLGSVTSLHVSGRWFSAVDIMKLLNSHDNIRKLVVNCSNCNSAKERAEILVESRIIEDQAKHIKSKNNEPFVFAIKCDCQCINE